MKTKIKRISKRTLSMVLSLMMVLSTVMVGGSFTVDAAAYYCWYSTNSENPDNFNTKVELTAVAGQSNKYEGELGTTTGNWQNRNFIINTNGDNKSQNWVSIGTKTCDDSINWIQDGSNSGRTFVKSQIKKSGTTVKITFDSSDNSVYMSSAAEPIVSSASLTISPTKVFEIGDTIILTASHGAVASDADASKISYSFYLGGEKLGENTTGVYEYKIPNGSVASLSFTTKVKANQSGYQDVTSSAKTATVSVPASYSIAGRFAINDFGTEKKIGWVQPGTSSDIKFDYVGKVGTSYEYRLDTGKTIKELSQNINQGGNDKQYFYITNDDNHTSYGKSSDGITGAAGVANKIDLAQTTSNSLLFNNSTSTDERKVVLHLLATGGSLSLYYTLENSSYSKIYACDGNLRTSGTTVYSKNFGHTTVTAEETGVLKTDRTETEYSIYTAKTGKEVTISTTVDSAYKALYVNAFVVNGVKLPATPEDDGTTYTAKYTVTGEDVEIYPVYYNKYAEAANDYITVYVDASEIQNSDNHWGDMIGAYTYYSNSGNEMDAGYPGQPMMYDPSVGYYVGKVARHAWAPTSDTEITESMVEENNKTVKGVVFSNFAEGNNDVHKSFVTSHNHDLYFRDDEAVNFQTYDYDDFVDLASYKAIKYTIKYSGLTYKDYYVNGTKYTIHSGYLLDYKSLIYSNQKKFGLQTQDGGTGYRTNTTTEANIDVLNRSFENGWRTLEEFYGYNATISGAKVANDLLDKTTTSRPDHFLQVVSVGNQHHSIGSYATVWYVYDEKGAYITCGIPSDFLDSESTAYTTIKNLNRNSFTDYEDAVTYITYESEMCSQTSYQVDDGGNYDADALNSNNKLRNTGVRVDGRWTYSSEQRDVDVQIMYGQDAAAASASSWKADTYDTARETDVTGKITSANAEVSFKDSAQNKSNVRFGRSIDTGTETKLSADVSSDKYNFAGWFVADEVDQYSEPVSFRKFTDSPTYTATLNNNTKYYAMYVPKAGVHVISAYYSGGSTKAPLDITSSNNKTLITGWTPESVLGDDTEAKKTTGATTNAVAKAEFNYKDSDNQDQTITDRDITEHISFGNDVTITADKSSTKDSKTYKLVGWYVEGTDTDEGKFVPVNYKTSTAFDDDGKLGGTVTLNTPSVTVYALYVEQVKVNVHSAVYTGSSLLTGDTSLTTTNVTPDVPTTGLNGKTTNAEVYVKYNSGTDGYTTDKQRTLEDLNVMSTVELNAEDNSTNDSKKYKLVGWYTKSETGVYETLPDGVSLSAYILENSTTDLYAIYNELVNVNVVSAYYTGSGVIGTDSLTTSNVNNSETVTGNVGNTTGADVSVKVKDSSDATTRSLTDKDKYTEVSLSASENGTSNYKFVGWFTLDGSNYQPVPTLSSSTGEYTLENSSTTLYAIYSKSLTFNVVSAYYNDNSNVINPATLTITNVDVETATGNVGDITGGNVKAIYASSEARTISGIPQNAQVGISAEDGTNYKFVGWYTKSGDNYTAVPAADITGNKYNIGTENVTLYAVYKKQINVTVKSATFSGDNALNKDALYDGNGGTTANVAVEPETGLVGNVTGATASATLSPTTSRSLANIDTASTITLSADANSTNDSKKYRLVGWFVLNNSTHRYEKITLSAGDTYKLSDSDVTFYAIYIEQFDVETKVVYTDGSHKDELDENDGSGVTKAKATANGYTNKITVDKNAEVTFAQSKVGDSDYSFSGWKADQDTDAPNVSLTDNKLKITDNTTLYAAYTVGNVNLNAIPAFKNKPNDEHYTTTDAKTTTKSTQTITVSGYTPSTSGTLSVAQNTAVSANAFTQSLDSSSEYVFVGWTTKDPTNATIASSDVLTSTSEFTASANTTYYALYVKKMDLTLTHDLFAHADGVTSANNGSGNFSISAKVDEGAATTSSIVHDNVASVTITPADSIVKDLYLGTDHNLNVTLTATPDTNNTNRSSYVQPYGAGPFTDSSYSTVTYPNPTALSLTTLYNNNYTTTNYYTDIEKNKATVEVKIKRQDPTNRTAYLDDSADDDTTTGTVTNATAKVNEARSQEVYIGTALDTLSFVADPTGTGEVKGTDNKYYKFKGWYDKDGNAITDFGTKTVSATAEDNVIYAYYDIVTVTVKVETHYTDNTHNDVKSINDNPITNACANSTSADTSGVSTVTVDKGSTVTLDAVKGNEYYEFSSWTSKPTTTITDSGETSSKKATFVAMDNTDVIAQYNKKGNVTAKIVIQYKSKSELDWHTDDANTKAVGYASASDDSFTSVSAEIVKGHAAHFKWSTVDTTYKFVGLYTKTGDTYNIISSVADTATTYTQSDVQNDLTVFARFENVKVNVQIAYKDSPTDEKWTLDTYTPDTADNYTGVTTNVKAKYNGHRYTTLSPGSTLTYEHLKSDEAGNKYTLVGWYKDGTVAGNKYTAGTEVTTDITNVNDDITIYALYAKLGSVTVNHKVYEDTDHSIKGTTIVDYLRVKDGDKVVFSNKQHGDSSSITATTYADWKEVVKGIYMGEDYTLTAELTSQPDAPEHKTKIVVLDTLYKNDVINSADGTTGDKTFTSQPIILDDESYAIYMQDDVSIDYYTEFKETFTVTGMVEYKDDEHSDWTPDTKGAIATISIDSEPSSAPNNKVTKEYEITTSKTSYEVTVVTTNKKIGEYDFDSWNGADVTTDGKATLSENTTITARYKKSAPTTKEITVEFKYYDRKMLQNDAANGTANINKEETVIKSNYTYTPNDTDGIAKLSSIVLEKANDLKLGDTDNYIDEYVYWTNQSDAVEGISKLDNYHTGGKYPSTPYHTDCYGNVQSGGEYWVTYTFTDNSRSNELGSHKVAEVKDITVWLFNQPKKYTVTEIAATKESELTAIPEKTDYFVSNNSSSISESYEYFYNTRLSGKQVTSNPDIDDAAANKATEYLQKYGVTVGYFSDFIVPAEYINSKTFAYWSSTADGLTPVSTDIAYGNRITNDMKLYAVYTTATTSNKGVSVTKATPDYYVDASGAKKIRLNNVINIYGFEDSDTSIQNVGIVYVKLGKDVTLDTTDITNIIDDIADYVKTANFGKSNTPSITVDISKENNGSLVYKYQTTNPDGSSYAKLTNKNRIQLSINGNESNFTTGQYQNLAVFGFAITNDTVYVSDTPVIYTQGK